MNETKDGSIAHVVANFMFLLVASLLSVLMGKFVVRAASGRQRNLVVVDLVAVQIAQKSLLKCEETMSNNSPICNGCRTTRTREAQPPRELIRLPSEVTQDKIFSKRGIPVFLCEFCDAYELEAALAAHEKRIDNK